MPSFCVYCEQSICGLKIACRYVSAGRQKGAAQLKALWLAVRQAVVGFHERRLGITIQAGPVTQQLISRAITVAAYAFSLECGHMLALPTWLRIICAYSVAALVPTLLPNAHGDNCRVFTTILASALAATLASPTAAVGATPVLRRRDRRSHIITAGGAEVDGRP